MTTIQNDIFRIISIRGADDSIVSDPIEDPQVEDVDGPIVLRLEEIDFDVGPETLSELDSALDALDLEGAAKRLDQLFDQLAVSESEITYGDATLSAPSLRDHQPFRQDVAAIYNLWLLRKLESAAPDQLAKIERRLGAALRIYKRVPAGLGPGPRPVLPSKLRRRRTTAKAKAADAAFKKTYVEPTTSDDRAERLESAQVDLAAIAAIEFRLHSGLAEPFVSVATETSDTVITGRTRPGPLSWLFSRPEPASRTVRRAINTPALVTGEIASSIAAGLDGRATKLFTQTLDALGDAPPVNAVINALATRKNTIADLANGLAWEIATDATFSPDTLPEPENDMPLFDQGAVEALGFGDLIVARETLVDYDAREISHIENVLKNEKKTRDHTLTRTIEETFETEVTETEESERELETTTRNELQLESEKVIEDSFSIRAGVNTSGRYGLTKVETSVDAGFQRSTREARASTTEIAKEVVSKAVERTFRTVRELQRRTVTTEIREVNAHTLDNVGSETEPISGIYKWVEKVHEIELRHYGTRLMVEFSIPEPALSIVGQKPEPEVDIPEPRYIWFDASGINEGNYLAYARIWGARDLEPPPPAFVNVGFAWSSQPSESDDENKSEDVLSEYVAIPDGYRPISGEFNISAHPSQANHFLVRLHIADHHFSQDGDAHFSRVFSLSAGGTTSHWPNGVPVSMTAHGHFDRTMSLNITFTCYRRTEAYRRWQLDTYGKIVDGYERQSQERAAALEEASLESEQVAPISGGPDAVNRRIEREELQKWATKILRRVPFDLDATISVGTGAAKHAEIDPARADRQSELVGFYQEVFEWENMSYFFYPYFWGRRSTWRQRLALRRSDPRYEAFLRAGAARMIVPVTPGYEARMLYYLANPGLPEDERISDALPQEPVDPPPPSVADTVYDTLWLELALAKNTDLALGSGALNVTQGSRQVAIIDSRWEASTRDLGRELYIQGDRYEVSTVIDVSTIEIEPAYSGLTDPQAPYATGSVPFGPPWLVKLPTNLVVLSENADKVRLDA